MSAVPLPVDARATSLIIAIASRKVNVSEDQLEPDIHKELDFCLKRGSAVVGGIVTILLTHTLVVYLWPFLPLCMQELGKIKLQDSNGGNFDNFIDKEFSGRIPSTYY